MTIYEDGQIVSIVPAIEKDEPDFNLELAILGCCFSDEACIDGVRLLPEAFRDIHLRRIFEMMKELRAKQIPVELISMQELYKTEFASRDFYELVAELYKTPYNSKNIQWYVYQLNHVYRQKVFYALLQTIIDAPKPDGFELNKTIEWLMERLEKLIDEYSGEKDFSFEAEMSKILRRSDKDNPEPMPLKIDTGFDLLDKKLEMGIQSNYLVVLGGLPGTGKTTLAMNIVRNVMLDQRHSVLYFTFEMKIDFLMTKLLAACTDIPFGRFSRGELTPGEMNSVHAAMLKSLPLNPLKIYYETHKELAKLVTKIRYEVKLNPAVKFIVVDHLHLMLCSSTSNALDKIETITSTLKGLAGELDVPILLLSQLTKQDKTKGGLPPTMSELRGSGSISADADIVMLLHRKLENNPHNLTELHILKNRGGAPDQIVPLRLRGEIDSFVESNVVYGVFERG